MKKPLFPKNKKRGTLVLVEVWNTDKTKSEWVDGELLGYAIAELNDDFDYRLNVQTDDRYFGGCSPECVKLK